MSHFEPFISVAALGDLSLIVLPVVCVISAAALARGLALRAHVDRKLAEMGERELELEKAALTDAVTGLKNRVAFSKELEALIERGGQGEFAVLFLDLDRFKEVNDTLGHKIGDGLLKGVATRLRELLPAEDVLARIGGDEFAAIVRVDPARRVDDLAIAIVEAVYEPFLIEGHVVHVGASVGIAKGMRRTSSAEELLRQADIAMYDAKFSKTDSFRIFDERMSNMIALRSSMRSELEKAIREDELSLKYQPVVDSHTGELSSAEALLRWPNSSQGEISPGDLIPLAEESGQILALGGWILDKALLAVRELKDVPVAVNVSPIQFRHHGFATIVGDKLLATGVAPELLRLEITEGVLISHMDAAKSTIRQLRQMGVVVVLDDFGTGYSSLSYLQNLDFDYMKIDKSFMKDLGRRQLATQIMRCVIELGHSLELKVVAGGIENDWQARLLQLLNCDYLQGYFLGAPMSLEDLHAFRANNNIHEKLNRAASQELPDLAVRVANG
ncbi:MAG: diguanylate cyclase/phosphodiesterase (GGDEF & EAL domains) with PAS/PAC sensor(s) [uncultured Sphingosinicella sp.]|uniref:Diguanylate cyclase/phosphodiesterase (GGDEF & EAL domains) with PAS/PAC sensor(S) n=1 Tax=uncultured Sphingosinicella sp. TaxID=478748 RepID=A0A6J4TM05_9SPHN|nr:EAL domain-containing protein [uncultured Sphingosinicella sp.]CAA9526676.1 MAG: diguanylate cyclase/phosphodiesterase (GGDEF & EAL domains) with PAS/PAC sensor(s) [uncultured Sphingosinicella sp.]